MVFPLCASSLARIFHELLAATTDMVILPGVLGCRPCDVPFRYGNQHPAVARWHDHPRGLATAIHEISGLVAITREMST